MMQEAIDFLLNLELHVMWMVFIIFTLSVIHPMISQPWSLLSVTVASIWFGIPLALVVLWSGYLIGMIGYYFIIKRFNQKYQWTTYPKFKKAVKWLEMTPAYQHAISLGTPLVPTYVIKMMLPLTEKSFYHYMCVMIGSYVLLTISNVLLYYGIFVEALLGPRSWITFIILFILIVTMYVITHIKYKPNLNS